MNHVIKEKEKKRKKEKRKKKRKKEKKKRRALRKIDKSNPCIFLLGDFNTKLDERDLDASLLEKNLIWWINTGTAIRKEKVILGAQLT